MRIVEVFNSIMGECGDTGQGAWTTFVRFAGCNLNCWGGCDTPQAMKANQGRKVSPSNLMMDIMLMAADKTNRILFTGGEPLLQDRLDDLLCMLPKGLHISLETNGTLPFSDLILSYMVDCIIADYKLPSTGMSDKMQPIASFASLRGCDWIKYVIADKCDYEFAKSKAMEIKKFGFKGKMAFSPKMGGDISISPQELYGWMLKDGFFLPSLSIQIHKLIGCA